MQTLARIRKLGFRRWYERTLVEAHAHLVTCLLGTILAFAGMEMVLSHVGPARGLVGVGVGAIGVWLTLFGISHYARLLTLAQRLGSRATCSNCGTHGAFTLLAGGPEAASANTPVPESDDNIWLKVKCRSCGNIWTL